MNPHAFFIIGLRESGKELVANLLSHTLGERRGATSSIIYDEVARQRGVPRWEVESLPKDELVPELVRVGNSLCATDPSALVAPLLRRGVRVVYGIRRRVELAAARRAAATQGLTPVVVWLDRGEGSNDNTEVSREDADYVIANHGSVGHLAKLVANLAAEFRTPEPMGPSVGGVCKIDEPDAGPARDDFGSSPDLDNLFGK